MKEAFLYKKLYQNLKEDILSGKYLEGDILPSENLLKTTWHITRSTVRRALLELEKEGHIAKQQGKGSIVLPQRRRPLGLLSVKGFSQVVSEAKQPVKTVMIEKPTHTLFPHHFFYPCSEVEKKAGCIFLKRLRCVNDDPVMLESTYISDIGLADLTKHPLLNGSLFDTLHKVYRIEMTAVEQNMRAMLAGKEESYWLKIKRGHPLLLIYLKFHTNRDHVFIYSSLICNTENYTISNTLT